MPEATVAAIITNTCSNAIEVLLTLRRIEPFKDQWCLPGGHIDEYEPVREAIIREVKEETGLHFEARFFNYFDEIMPEYKIHAVVITFEGHGTGEFDAQEDEVVDMRWFHIDEARSLPLAFTHNAILDAYYAYTRQ